MNKKTILGFIIATIILVVFFFYFVDFREVLGTISSANPLLYLVSISFIAGSIYAWGYRWKTFVNIQGYEVKTSEILGNLIVGVALNNITPFTRLGGEPVRAYLLKKRNGVDYSDGLASVLADGAVVVIFTILFVILTIFLIPLVMNPPSWLILGLGAFGVVMFLILLIISGVYRGSDYVLRFIDFLSSKIRYLRERKDSIRDKYFEFQESFRMSMKNKRSLLIGFSTLAIGKILNIFSYFFIFLSLGQTVPLLHILIVMGLIQIIMFLPVTPGSLGIYEGAFVSAFVVLGVAPAVAASAVLLQRLIWFWGLTGLGGYLGTYYGVEQFQGLDL